MGTASCARPVKPSSVIFDIRVLWRSALISKITNDRCAFSWTAGLCRSSGSKFRLLDERQRTEERQRCWSGCMKQLTNGDCPIADDIEVADAVIGEECWCSLWRNRRSVTESFVLHYCMHCRDSIGRQVATAIDHYRILCVPWHLVRNSVTSDRLPCRAADCIITYPIRRSSRPMYYYYHHHHHLFAQ